LSKNVPVRAHSSKTAPNFSWQYLRMLSAHTRIEEPGFAKHSLLKSVEGCLYRSSPIGDASAIIYPVKPLFSTICPWTNGCPLLWKISLQKEIDAEDPEGGEQRSGLYADRVHGCRKCRRVESLFASEPKGHRILMDLKDLTLADREAVKFLGRCEADSIETTNCPAYISRVDHQRAALTTTIVVAACSALTVGKETLIS
jgi:hypothetical protein